MDLAKSNSAFAFDVYATIIQSRSGCTSNIFFSPYSISATLQLVYFGARDATLQQLLDVLHLNRIGVDKLEHNYIELSAQINQMSCPKETSCKLSAANKLFAEKSFDCHQDYIKCLKNVQTDLEQCDFHGNPDKARQEINHWVEKQTAAKISDLLPSNSVNADTPMILVNAIYFKAPWLSEFKYFDTCERKFSLLDGSDYLVPMMYQHTYLESRHDLCMDATILKLPFRSSMKLPISMVIILPDKVDGLLSMEAMLKSDSTLRLNECTKQNTKIYLPRMRIEDSLPLTQLLQTMGVKDLFDKEAANLSGISDREGLHVSEAYHKAFIEVNEEGAEAAAATGVGFHFCCGRLFQGELVTICVDHPFMLLIMDLRTDSILFMGRMLKV